MWILNTGRFSREGMLPVTLFKLLKIMCASNRKHKWLNPVEERQKGELS